MFTFIDGNATIWLIVLAVVLIFGVAIPISRIRTRRRLRKKEWSASYDPITIDFTGQAGLTGQRLATTVVDNRGAAQAEIRTSP